MFWYHNEIDRLQIKKSAMEYDPKLVFYGSSSFRLWKDLEEEFAEYQPINLGFGGSTMAACSWFFKKSFEGLQPDGVVVYAGDNDLGDGRHPEEVIMYFMTLLFQIRKKYGDHILVTFISIKPSPSRWHLAGSINYTNKKVREFAEEEENCFFIDIYDAMLDEYQKPNGDFFVEDNLHMNEAGYEIWLHALKNSPQSFPKIELIT